MGLPPRPRTQGGRAAAAQEGGATVSTKATRRRQARRRREERALRNWQRWYEAVHGEPPTIVEILKWSYRKPPSEHRVKIDLSGPFWSMLKKEATFS